jgi:hypothetical protein
VLDVAPNDIATRSGRARTRAAAESLEIGSLSNVLLQPDASRSRAALPAKSDTTDVAPTTAAPLTGSRESKASQRNTSEAIPIAGFDAASGVLASLDERLAADIEPAYPPSIDQSSQAASPTSTGDGYRVDLGGPGDLPLAYNEGETIQAPGAVDWFSDDELERRLTDILRAQVKRHGLDPCG